MRWLIVIVAIVSAQAQGIPVTDPLVIAKCGTCHNLDRIAQSRTTPEGWQTVLKDMIVLNGLSVTPDEARSIVKYLSTTHGLAPDEAKAVAFDAERRIREENIESETLREACAHCHTMARALGWRRSEDAWKQFVDSHAKRESVKPERVAEAVEFLSKAAPLHTREWDAWSAANKVSLAGRWLVTATLPGHGQFYGDMQIEKTGDDEFTTKVNLTSVKDGAKIARTGRSVAYAGTAWRARSTGTNAVAGPDDPNNDAREVMWFSADHATAEGRWFWGQYQEFGFNVKLTRATPNPTLLLTDRLSLKAGSRGNRIRLIGENLPADGLALGAGVTVRRIVSKSPTEMIAEVDVAANAAPGKRDIRLRTAILPAAISVYDHIDYIQVTPESGTASFGDHTHPRGFLQFEALAYQRGPDGKMHTDDDLSLGPVDATWNLEIFHAAPGSNADIVGKMSATGLLSPATVNPNVNFDTWVTATVRDEPLTGKAYTVVAIPTYAFNGRQYIRDLDRWIDDGPAAPGRGQANRPPRR